MNVLDTALIVQREGDRVRSLAQHLLTLADRAEAALCKHPRVGHTSTRWQQCHVCSAMWSVHEGGFRGYETPRYIEEARQIAKRELGE